VLAIPPGTWNRIDFTPELPSVLTPQVGHVVGTPAQAVRKGKGGQGGYRTRKAGNHQLHHGKGELRERRAKGHPAGAAPRPDKGKAAQLERGLEARQIDQRQTQARGHRMTAEFQDQSGFVEFRPTQRSFATSHD